MKLRVLKKLAYARQDSPRADAAAMALVAAMQRRRSRLLPRGGWLLPNRVWLRWLYRTAKKYKREGSGIGLDWGVDELPVPESYYRFATMAVQAPFADRRVLINIAAD